jgi:hypothetical protein
MIQFTNFFSYLQENEPIAELEHDAGGDHIVLQCEIVQEEPIFQPEPEIDDFNGDDTIINPLVFEEVRFLYIHLNQFKIFDVHICFLSFPLHFRN